MPKVKGRGKGNAGNSWSINTLDYQLSWSDSAMQIGERKFFTARCARDAEFAKRKYVFFSGERPEKKSKLRVLCASAVRIVYQRPFWVTIIPPF
jgi:hypothetical protein